ncbi:NADP-dependent phosphogluconate dehydrogenase [Falsiruegeria mediterranea]|uniref:6-phosphogluconate dehydrogenase, decarboxylating n=1 Tax=Falsiruegeria mediterranea M17 TaxID=1200281 RepID=A0A2R8C7U1_9RHOB|nr:NADP-dependent phosphogluconate dehydrogenase [Falsiruegeria mediterranea]SPJ28426.1 6-phosphogluconate dehydrogenase, NADP(+)-dependent, decarboxylating [Falsiruegeria mediterranea M17]
MAQQQAEASAGTQVQVGVYGLGTMGSALALNLADKGIRIAVSNREADWIDPFLEEAGPLSSRITGAADLGNFVAALASPRVIILMIPSGAPVDDMLAQLSPLLNPDDTVVDAGNADFNETRRRTAQAKTFHFVGMGVSGGEEGARHGPSMMVGGSDHSWQQLQPILEPIAAEFQGDPCVAHVGTDGAGHFVKTVHNGIEYADMQMIAEVYGVLRDGQGWEAPQIGALFANWSAGKLASFLVETTAKVLHVTDTDSGKPLVDVIRDQAGQKGTGRWTVIEALKLGQSASAIEAAVGARAWSSAKSARLAAATQFPGVGQVELDPATLENALFAGRVLAHLQGFEVLRAASAEFDWSLDLARIAEIWRAGCIIRSSLLDELAPLLRKTPQRPVLLADGMAELLAPAIPALRQVVGTAVAAGLPVPALSAGLAWFDTARQGTGTANLIQAQRDAFGVHGFERMDMPGKHHGDWG